MSIDTIPVLKRLIIPYVPHPEARGFLDRVQTQTQDGVTVGVAVLDAHESRRYFGVPMARRGIQPVWLKITNASDEGCRLDLFGIDPNYYSPHEAASANHFSSGKRLLGFGMLALVFFWLLLLIPIKLFAAMRANRHMDAFFLGQAFRLRPIDAGHEQEGFVFTPLDIGNKIVHVRLYGPKQTREFIFSIPVPGLDVDYTRREFQDLYPPAEQIVCDMDELQKRLAEAPHSTTNRSGQRHGDPMNLVVIGEFPSLISAFGARWDETESITLATSWRTARAFLLGSEYRYSPVSPLYVYGRSQDFALQRIRQSINERLHLRLWITPLRFQGLPVWVGQISRDIGVRFTLRTWNLTTHRIDPDVDEARDYVVEDLLHAGRLELAGYASGVGACDASAPRRNLGGDPYFTDGKRATLVVSPSRTTPKFVAWS